jgi:predicted transcriptional regulator
MTLERKLLDAEWTILRAMWGKPPQTMREIIAAVQDEQPDIKWHYKTYHSYLRIMLEKGLIACEDKNLRDKLYRPLVTKDEALRQESETLLSRISTASMGGLVAAMAKSAPLSDADRKVLMAMARQLEAKDGEPS